MATLDDIDRRLLALLRNDGRLPAATLARHLGVSRGTVQNRLDRLVVAGVILGFTVRLQTRRRGRRGAGDHVDRGALRRHPGRPGRAAADAGGRRGAFDQRPVGPGGGDRHRRTSRRSTGC